MLLTLTIFAKSSILEFYYCVKRVRIRSYSGPHFSRIFPHSDWIRRDTPYLSVLSSNVEKCGRYADQNNSEHGFFLRSVITYNNVFQFHWNAVLCQGCYNILFFQIALNIVLSHSPRQVARIHYPKEIIETLLKCCL